MSWRHSRFLYFIVWLLIYAILLPTPMIAQATVPAYTNSKPINAHVMRRLNSPERAAAIAEAARKEAEADKVSPQSEAAAPVASAFSGEKAARLSPSSGKTDEASPPKSVGEVFFNYAVGFAGFPGLLPNRSPDDSLDEGLGFHQDGTARNAGGDSYGSSADGKRALTYMKSGLQGGTALYTGFYGEQYCNLWGREDPTRGQSVYSSSSAYRSFEREDLQNRALSWGAGAVNSMGEAAISGLVDEVRTRLNFQMDKDGYFSGEGDVLLPFYDDKHTTVYTQVGARSMHDSSDTRWIGNFGLGQRWFPFAEGNDVKSADYDAGNLMLGYNVFFDYDFTRYHQRGGVGAEAQYDWLRFSSNFYAPLSDWRGSKDFDSRFVKERSAKGWDARAKAHLPFYRNVALTGSYSQWFGDHVGVFGASNLEKDPKVWSYGMEYTPVPLVSGYISQKSTERGRTDAEFGLNFTYHFQMPWEDQIKHSKVAELRTVNGSRHEFVDRENKIILEYKAKSDYYIEYVGPNGGNTNEFVFRVKKAFGGYTAGQTVRVTASGVTLAEAPVAEKSFFARAGDAIVNFFSVSTAHAADSSESYVTDSQGQFIVKVKSSWAGSLTLHALVLNTNHNTQTFTLYVAANETYTLDGGGTPITMLQHTPQNVTVTLANNGIPLPGKSVTFAANAAFTNLPATAQTTDSSGQIVLAGLVGTVAGTHTVLAAVDSQTVNLTVNVTPATYTLDMTPSALTAQHVPQSVVFTLYANGTPLAGASLTFEAAANTTFDNLPTGAQTTSASGQITVSNLIGRAVGSGQSIYATVGGQSVSAAVSVSSNATYALNPIAITMAQHTAQTETFTVTVSGTPVPGVPVTFAANPSFTNLPTGTLTTDASGQVTVSNLIATVAGTQTLSVDVDGQSFSVTATVTAATYALEPTPNTLVQGMAKGVTFTLKANGVPLANTLVAFGTNTNFTGLPATATTDSSGKFTVSDLVGTLVGNSQTITATVGSDAVVSEPINVAALSVSFTAVGAPSTASSFTSHDTTTFTVNLTVNGENYSGAVVIWSVHAADNSANQAVVSSHMNRTTGLSWGAVPSVLPSANLITTPTSSTVSSGNASIQLTDIMGERKITARAAVTIGTSTYTVDQDVTFGAGPLAIFRAPGNNYRDWLFSYSQCNGPPYPGTPSNPAEWFDGAYVGGGKMPTRAEIAAAFVSDAQFSAGWQAGSYWTGEAQAPDTAYRYSTSGVAIAAPISYSAIIMPLCRR